MSQNWGPEKKSVSQNWGPKKKSDLKTRDRKEFYSQSRDQKRICISELGPKIFFPVPCFEITILFRSQFSDQNSFPIPTFDGKIVFRSSLLRYTFLFRSPILRHILSLEFSKKCQFHLYFQVLKKKNHDIVISGQASLTYGFW